ncbi:hypothetical protein BOTBODRAFT_179926 [Botryobasidium botryosum FD-172 SS1]|uniref:Reverse transcriptase domain-containing protein n=1 Tax=Botryobasidium botryosum (strain FD-172 SS1) TaxID=930990 RepID=A0A067M9P0_BOTB1|nr:hypothetical protein BOTBODRAFT_179926 [Botryobasidium botryosum FD-172 SS1]
MAPLFVIKCLSRGVSAAAALRFYLGAIRPILIYSAPTWWSDKAAHGDKLNSYQYRLLNRCLGTFRNTRTWVTLAMAGVPPLNAHLNVVVELYVSRTPYYFASHLTRKLILSILDDPPATPPTILERAAAFINTHGLPTPTIIHPGTPTHHPRSWIADDIRNPPPFAGDGYVIPLLEAVALTGTPVLFVGIDHKNAHLKIFPRFMPPDSPFTSAVYTIQLPEHTIGERAHAAALTLIDAMANMPAHLLMPDIALVITNRALVDSLVHPNRRMVYHSHLHELASRCILDSPRTFHIFVINKWHLLHPPKKAFYYRPPTYVPASFQDHCQSRRVTTRKIKQLLAQSFAEDLETHIPQDHIYCTFGLIRDASDTIYPTFVALQRPASQTATLARLASGHTFVGSYYKSRNIPDTEYSCPCGVDVQDIPHVFLDCPITAPFKHLLLDKDGDLDTSILFTDKLDSLLEWLKATNAFTKRFGLWIRLPVTNLPSVSLLLSVILRFLFDGLSVLWTGNKWERIAELIPHLLAALNAWANSFGISIDPRKTEVMWLFPDGRKPPPPLPGLNVVEVMQWLGVDYDQKLTFNAHVANILKKANNNMAPLFVIKR